MAKVTLLGIVSRRNCRSADVVEVGHPTKTELTIWLTREYVALHAACLAGRNRSMGNAEREECLSARPRHA